MVVQRILVNTTRDAGFGWQAHWQDIETWAPTRTEAMRRLEWCIAQRLGVHPTDVEAVDADGWRCPFCTERVFGL